MIVFCESPCLFTLGPDCKYDEIFRLVFSPNFYYFLHCKLSNDQFCIHEFLKLVL